MHTSVTVLSVVQVKESVKYLKLGMTIDLGIFGESRSTHHSSITDFTPHHFYTSQTSGVCEGTDVSPGFLFGNTISGRLKL